MKLLRDILYKVGLVDVVGPTNVAIENISFDSRKPGKFGVFVAIRGHLTDGHQYIDSAIENGAIAVVCEEFPETLSKGISYVKVEDTSWSLASMAANFHDNPSEELKLIGITGTNGKTTVATLLHELYTSMGYKVGLISTVVNKISNAKVKSTHTTPDPLQLNDLFRQMVNNGCTHCFMEVSSHAIVQQRVAGLKFTGAVFTNITHDHLDYHKTFDAYIAAKKQLFDQLGNQAFALINKDDKHAAVMIQNSSAKIQAYAMKSFADFKCKIVESDFNGMQLNIDNNEVWTKLIGNFNAYNLTAVYAVARLLGEDTLNVLTGISSLSPVEGRFQYFQSTDKVSAIVDYAHTPDALKNVLSTIGFIRSGNEQLIALVGCGGDRDKEKRPKMAQIASELCDLVILTSDNPRSEDPEKIIEDMKEGVEPQNHKKVLAIVNRAEAIKTATTMAKPGDIILVAGKGHEKYQEIAGERLPFDDFKLLRKSLKKG